MQVKTKRDLEPNEQEDEIDNAAMRAPPQVYHPGAQQGRGGMQRPGIRRREGNGFEHSPTILGAAVYDAYADPSTGHRHGDGSDSGSTVGAGRKRRADRLSRDVVSTHEDYVDAAGVAGGPMGGFRDYYAYGMAHAPEASMTSLLYEGYVPGAPQNPHMQPQHPGRFIHSRPVVQNPGRASVESGGDASWDGNGTGDEGYDTLGVNHASGFEGDVSEAESETSHTGMSAMLARTQISQNPPHIMPGQMGAFAYNHAVRHSKMRRIDRPEGSNQQPVATQGGDFGAMNAVDLLLRASGETDGAPVYANDLQAAAAHSASDNISHHMQRKVLKQQKRKPMPAGHASNKPMLGKDASVSFATPPLEVVHCITQDPANSAIAETQNLDIFGDTVAVWRLTFADAHTCTADASEDGTFVRVGAKPIGEGVSFRLEANNMGCIMFNVSEDRLLLLPFSDNVWLHPLDFHERQTVAAYVRERKGTYYTLKGRYLRTVVSLIEEDDTDALYGDATGRGSFSAARGSFSFLSGATQHRKPTGSFSADHTPTPNPVRKRTRQEVSYELFSAQEHVYVSYWPSGTVKMLLCAFGNVQVHGRITKEEYEVMKMSAGFQQCAPAPSSPQSPTSSLAPGVLAALRTLPPADQLHAALAALQAGDEVTYKAILHLVNHPQLPRTTAYSRGESFSEGPVPSANSKVLGSLDSRSSDDAGLPPVQHAYGDTGTRRNSHSSYSSGGFSYGYVDTDVGMHHHHGAPHVHGWQNNWATNMAAAQAVAAANATMPIGHFMAAGSLVGPQGVVSMVRSPSEQQLMRTTQHYGNAFPLGAPQIPSGGAYHPGHFVHGSSFGHSGSFSGRLSGDFTGNVSMESHVNNALGPMSPASPPEPPAYHGFLPSGADGRTISSSYVPAPFPEYPPPYPIPNQPVLQEERTESSSSLGLRFPAGYTPATPPSAPTGFDVPPSAVP
jgi:hypothetical protein